MKFVLKVPSASPVNGQYVHFHVFERVEGRPEKGWTSGWTLGGLCVVTPRWNRRIDAEKAIEWWHDEKVARPLPADVVVEEYDDGV